MKENIVIITGHGEYPQGVKSFIREVAGELKNIYYIKITEPHKSLIPHMHILIFVENEHLSNTKVLYIIILCIKIIHKNPLNNI